MDRLIGLAPTRFTFGDFANRGPRSQICRSMRSWGSALPGFLRSALVVLLEFLGGWAAFLRCNAFYMMGMSLSLSITSEKCPPGP